MSTYTYVDPATIKYPSFKIRDQGTARIKSLAYHRNGVSGRGFYTAAFTLRDSGGPTQNMVAVAAPIYNEGVYVGIDPGEVYVLDADLAAAGNVHFGSNSWRGDHYQEFMEQAIAIYRKATDF